MMHTRIKQQMAKPANLTALASSISAALSSGYVATAQAQDEAVEDEITVTGSRIVRRDFDAASPIVSVETERFENSGTLSVESVLNQMPQFVPGGTQYDQGAQASPTISLGIGTLNLRGIGTNRTLTLVDGRRAQPANATLVVDVNTIPAAAIQRVETITGGASAVYGADALAGVVNFILKDDFEGVELDFHTGSTEQGDGEETRFTALLGVNSEDGDGNVMLGVEWYKREGVMAVDRDFFLNGYFDPASDVTIFPFVQPAGYSPVFGGGLPTQAAVDSIFASDPTYFPCAGYATFTACGTVQVPGQPPGTMAPPAGQWKHPNTGEVYFNADGSPFIVAGAHGYNSGYDSPSNMTTAGDGFSGMRLLPNGNLAQNGYTHIASTPLERRSAFGRAVVDMGDNLSAFVQANYSSVEVTNTGGGAFAPAITVWSAPIPADHATGGRSIPPALATLLASRTTPTADWTLFRVLDFVGGAIQPVSTTDVYQIMAGLEGSFSNRDWTWEAYVSTGETDTTNFFHNLPSLQRYQYLVRQPQFGVGNFTLGRNYVMSCPTGLPIFRTTDPTASCLEAIDSKARALTEVTQNIAEFNLQGGLAEMRNGDLRFALGLSARENDFRYEPSETNDNVSTVENPVGIFAGNNTMGSTEVKELYGELLVPVFERLELELGYRLSDYDFLDDKVDTYKTLFTWRAADLVTFRGGYQQAERAPNTAELFQGPSLLVVPFAPSDPCSFTTTVPWGNVATNPNRVAVQSLCRQIINNSDINPLNDGQSSFDTNAAGPNGFARPAVPFFPLEIEVRQGNQPARLAGVPAVGSIKSESAETWTIGAIFNVAESLTMSVDFYDIEIADAIDTRNSLYVYAQCFNASATGNTGTSNPGLTYTGNPLCGTIRRNVNTGERAEVDAPYVNAGVIATTGVDLQLTWDKSVGDGSIFVNSLMTYLDSFETQDAPGEPIIENADTLAREGQFEYKLTNTFGYNFGGGRANIGLQWRHLPAIKDEAAARSPNTRILGVPSYDSFNLFAGFMIGERIQLRGGIDNLTDEDPPIVGTRLPGTNGASDLGDRNAENTRADFYDILGRRAYFGVKMAF
jgi:outer membrane receptor protein involved in Fe transport